MDFLEFLMLTGGDPTNPINRHDDDIDLPEEDTETDLGYLESDDDSEDYDDDFSSIWDNED